MKVPTAKELTEQLIPKAYRIPMLRPDGSPNDRVTIEERSTEDSVRRWAVVRGGSVLNNEGEWEHEPMPSNRDEGFLSRCRYTTLETACEQIVRWVTKEQEAKKEEKHDGA
jgi:hypothetical protein